MALDFDEYQRRARTTADYMGRGEWSGMAYCALGLAGEAGEVADQVSKVNRDDDTAPSAKRIAQIKHEIGDCLWFAAALCTELRLSLDEVARENLDMLASRKDRGVIHGDGSDR